MTQSHAQDAPNEQPTTAREWFRSGLALSKAGDWQHAHAAFARSYELEARVSTRFNLAVAALNLGHGRETLLHLEQFTRMAEPTLHAQALAEAPTLRTQALALVGTLELNIEPSDTHVRVDGEVDAAAREPMRRIHLDPGLHTLQLVAPGFYEMQRSFKIAASEVIHERIVLAPQAQTSPPPITAPLAVETKARAHGPRSISTQQDEPGAWWKASWLLGGAAVLVLGVTATVVVILVSSGDSASPSGGSAGVLLARQ